MHPAHRKIPHQHNAGARVCQTLAKPLVLVVLKHCHAAGTSQGPGDNLWGATWRYVRQWGAGQETEHPSPEQVAYRQQYLAVVPQPVSITGSSGSGQG